jgi:hypothetical protein
MKEEVKNLVSKAIRFMRFPFPVHGIIVLTSVLWCGILGIIDNETESTVEWFARYFQPLTLLMYGVPVSVFTLWIMLTLVDYRGYTPYRALAWALLLGCILGTVAVIGMVLIYAGIYLGLR